jgi:pectin methylesterase-like acyl-CoA thioesterase
MHLVLIDETLMECSEKVTVDITKTFVSLIGTDRSATIITWNQTAGGSSGTIYSATMTVRAMCFCAYNITFEV